MVERMKASAKETYRFFALIIPGLLAIMFLVGLVGNSTAALLPQNCEMEDGLVTFRCEDEPIAEVLEQLAAVARLEIYVIEPPHNASAQADFVREPLQDVLRRLLKGGSYAVVYTAGEGDATGVRFVEGQQGSPGRSTRWQGGMPGRSRSAAVGGRVSSNQRGRRSANEEIASPGQTRANGRGKGTLRGGRRSTHASSSFGGGIGDADGTLGTNARTPGALGGPGGSSGSTAGQAKSSDTFDSASPSDVPETYSSRDYDPLPPPTPGMSKRESSLRLKISRLESRIESGQSDRAYEEWSGVKGESYVIHDAERLQYYREELEELVYGD